MIHFEKNEPKCEKRAEKSKLQDQVNTGEEVTIKKNIKKGEGGGKIWSLWKQRRASEEQDIERTTTKNKNNNNNNKRERERDSRNEKEREESSKEETIKSKEKMK